MYLALYRKYRPRTFDEVISQEHITTTLKNQVLNGSTGHAYLFTGSRGTGKTSCAKILAMAVNCENPQGGNPCLECGHCREILDGSATDIVEMDAASNNGIDDVRQLRDEVAYTPVSCKYRVYIIDEVHMLSVSAFNALLKTLEEPPPHVKFILATTELHKVPATISSRCQRFEFRRVNAADSAERLLEVAAKESVKLERSAAELIARLSDGGMRDALSILDRCISAESDITPQTVRDCAGVADDAHLFALSEMIARHDTAGCIRLLGELHKGAKDIALIIGELSGHFRDMMLYKTAPNDRDLLNVLPDEQDKLFAVADMYSLEEILRCLTLLQQCADGIGKIKQRKTLAEMCFVKMCTGADVNTAVNGVSRPAAKPTVQPPVIEYRELPDEKPEVQKKPESELTNSERVQSARIGALLKETAKLAETPVSTADVTAEPPVQSVKEKAQPAVKSEPSFMGNNSHSGETAAPIENAPPYVEPTFDDVSFGEPPPENGMYGAREFSSSYQEDPKPIKAAEVRRKEPESVKDAVSDIQAKQIESVNTKPSPSISENTNGISEERKSAVIDEESAAKIAALTQQQWEEAIPQTSFMVASMLNGSTIGADGDVLLIKSSNGMLLKNIKGKEIANFEKEISAALGFSVHMKIVPEKAETDSTPSSPLEKFLANCREHGVIVKIKD